MPERCGGRDGHMAEYQQKKNNMPLWFSQHHQKPQHPPACHPPIACILLLFLSVNVLFLTLCVLFRPFPVHLTCRPPYQSNHSCRLLWVHSRSAGSSPPASGWVLGNGYLKARYFFLKVYLLSCKKNLFTPWQQLINQILWKLRGKRSSIAKASIKLVAQ